jgi:hypothetical protein
MTDSLTGQLHIQFSEINKLKFLSLLVLRNLKHYTGKIPAGAYGTRTVF